MGVSNKVMEVREASAMYDLQMTRPGVPVGYKQTEIGVIPEDWDFTPFSSIGNVIDGDRGANYPGSKDFNVDGYCLFLNAGNVTKSGFRFSECAFITQEKDERLNKGKLQRDDIVLTTRGTVGNFAHFDATTPFDHIRINSGMVILRRASANIDCYFLYVLLQSNLVTQQIERLTFGSAQPQLTVKGVNSFEIIVPPLPEQRAIATALSDMDALLDRLDQLITKKRNLKQAAMQQLLTGQTRLPGFEGEWEVKRLGGYVTFLRSGVNSRAELTLDDPVKYLHYGDVHASNATRLSPELLPSLPSTKAKTLDRLLDGDLVFADASEDLNGISKSVEIFGASNIEIVAGLHTIAARFDKNVLADGFKSYLQFCPSFSNHLRRLAAGTKVYATNRSHIASVEMRLPGIEEQIAIAKILSEMDVEIESLEQRRHKTRDLKQAMMQELLTGRTRLIKPLAQSLAEDKVPSDERKANVHFMRSVLAAEIIDQLHEEPTFGHVKFEKMLFLVEHLCEVDTGSTYRRKAAGPYDNKALRSIDSQLKKQQWFDARKEGGRYRYVPLNKQGGHKTYFDRYFSDISSSLMEILEAFRSMDTERCEIVATLFSAWSDLLREKDTISDDMIVYEVLNHWHESKKRIAEDRWMKALNWMRKKGFVPKRSITG